MGYAQGEPDLAGRSQRSPQQRKSRKLCKETYGKGDLHEPEEPVGRTESDP